MLELAFFVIVLIVGLLFFISYIKNDNKNQEKQKQELYELRVKNELEREKSKDEENPFFNVIKLETLISWKEDGLWGEKTQKIPDKAAVYRVFVNKFAEIHFGSIRTINGKTFCPNKNISQPDINSLQENFVEQSKFDKDHVVLYIGCTSHLNERLNQLAGMALGESAHTGGKNLWTIQNYQDYLYVAWQFVSAERDVYEEKEKAILIYKQEHDGSSPIANN